jgi:hypothetical protein
MIKRAAFLACVFLASFANANETEMKEIKIEVKLFCPLVKNYRTCMTPFLRMRELMWTLKNGHKVL